MEYLPSVSSHIDKLELLKKRILRFIFNDVNSSYDELLKKAKTTSLYSGRITKCLLWTTTYGLESIKEETEKLWNSLTDDMRLTISIEDFKKSLMTECMDLPK